MSADQLSRLITASHILHNHKVLDGYGHVSIRNPEKPETFFIAYGIAPALISPIEGLIELKVDDGEPVQPEGKTGWSECYGHSEVYKRFPTVQSVVHNHSPDVLPYTASGVPLRPITHMAGFLGTEVPVWDITSAYASGDKHGHDLLIRTTQLGASLAAAFSKTSTPANYIYTKASSMITGSTADSSTEPDHWAVLMRGHGMTIAGRSVEDAVYKAIYTQEAARAQTTALMTHNVWFGGTIEGTVPGEGGGKIKGGKVKMAEDLHYLSSKEAADTWTMNQHSLQRPWALWSREVECNPLYMSRNEKKVTENS